MKNRLNLARLRAALLPLPNAGEARRETLISQAVALVESEFSFNERRRALYDALSTLPSYVSGSYCYRYIEDAYESWFVFTEEIGDAITMYRAEYSIDETGKATIGTPAPCYREVNYVLIDAATVPASENASTIVEGAVVPLREGAVKEAALSTQKTALIKIIAPGWGSSGYYGAEVLKESGPAAFPAGTHMFWNHPSLSESVDRPERDLTYLAAVTKTAAQWLEGADAPAGDGLYCETAFQDAYAPRLSQLAPHIGVSIYAFAEASQGEAEGRKGPIVEKFLPSPFNTIDFVTVPGAGGEIVQLFESLGRSAQVIDERHAPTKPQEQSMKNEEVKAVEAKADEAKANEAANQSETPEARLQRENADLKRQLAEAALSTQAAQFAREKLDGFEMPQASRDRVRESVAPVFKDGENGAREIDRDAYEKALQEAAAREVKYAQEAFGWGTGTVTNGDGGTDLESAKEAKPSPIVEAARVEVGL